MKYAPVDTKLCVAFNLFMLGGAVDGVKIGSNSSATSGNVEFQFPPRIMSDSRKAEWINTQTPGDDKAVVLSTMSSREFTISWRYIIDGKEWDVGRVTRNVRSLRAYFAKSKDKASERTNLIVLIKMWAIGDPDNDMSARIKSADFKYGETMVMSAPDNTSSAFPLITDVTLDCALWTDGIEGDQAVATAASQTTYKIQGMKRLTPAWY